MKKKTIREVLNERGKSYGEFKEHARIAQALKDVLKSGPSWKRTSSSQREALEMVCHKMARTVNGDPNYADNFVDIAGYSQLEVDILRGDDKRGARRRKSRKVPQKNNNRRVKRKR